jgi:hypothetical protein
MQGTIDVELLADVQDATNRIRLYAPRGDALIILKQSTERTCDAGDVRVMVERGSTHGYLVTSPDQPHRTNPHSSIRVSWHAQRHLHVHPKAT